MARVESVARGEVHRLLDFHTVGANPDRLLHLPFPGVSREHSAFYWRDGDWVLSAGGRNGTYHNGRRIEGASVELAVGDVVAFGDPALAYRVTDLAPPAPWAACEEDGEVVDGEPGLLGIPTADGLEAMFTERGGPGWLLRRADGEAVVTSGATVVMSGRTWRVFLPGALTIVASATDLRRLVAESRARLSVRGAAPFRLVIESAHEAHDLGEYACHELVAELTAAHAADARDGVEPDERGWRTNQELARRLRVKRALIFLWAFQCRQRVKAAGFLDWEDVIATRARSEIRIGFAAATVE